MKILRIVGIAFGAAVVLFVGIGLFLPRTWNVERSEMVAAGPEKIHPLVDDLKRWQEWAAWNKEMDPKAEWTHSGPASGVGATWAWKGPKMGTGSMTIVRSEAAAGVWVDERIESDEVNAHGSLTFSPEPGGTRVTWKDSGTLPPVIGGYVRGMIQKMLGDHFETGLRGLKRAAEAAAAAPNPDAVPAPTATTR